MTESQADISLVDTVSGDRIILSKDRVLVGRQAKEGQVSLKSRLVNRVHALFDRKDGRMRVADLGSHNGTRLNGQLLPPGTYTELFDGDEIMFADEVFRFEAKKRIMRDHEDEIPGNDHPDRGQHPFVHYL